MTRTWLTVVPIKDNLYIYMSPVPKGGLPNFLGCGAVLDVEWTRKEIPHRTPTDYSARRVLVSNHPFFTNPTSALGRTEQDSTEMLRKFPSNAWSPFRRHVFQQSLLLAALARPAWCLSFAYKPSNWKTGTTHTQYFQTIQVYFSEYSSACFES